MPESTLTADTGGYVLTATLLLIALSGNLRAQSVMADYTQVPDIEYCTGGGHPLLMDVFVPKNRPGKPTPAVLWLHGGGWERGEKNGNSGALLLVGEGFVTASISNRLSGEAPFPAAIEDCKCAVRFLRANAAKYGIDPERIGVAGASAGGHLALLVATVDETAGLEGTGGWPRVSSRVLAASAWYGPTDFTVRQSGFQGRGAQAVAKFLGGTPEENPEAYRRASPITYVKLGDPPILMIHGDRDQLVPFDQSVRMLTAYQKAGLDATLVKVEGAGHDFAQASDKTISPGIDKIHRLTVDFFKKHLVGK